jgi:hypothetical protein
VATWVTAGYRRISPYPYDTSLGIYHHGTHRHFTRLESKMRLVKRSVHVKFIAAYQGKLR